MCRWEGGGGGGGGARSLKRRAGRARFLGILPWVGGEIPGDLAPGEARSRGGEIPGTPGAMPGSSTLIFVFFSVKNVC